MDGLLVGSLSCCGLLVAGCWSAGLLFCLLAGVLVSRFVVLPAVGLLVCLPVCWLAGHWFAGLLACLFVSQWLRWNFGFGGKLCQPQNCVITCCLQQ